MGLTREQILACNDLTTESVSVPEWGGDVKVRSITASERDKWEADSFAKDKKGTLELRMQNMRARLVVMAVCDDTGTRMFKDTDATQIGRKSASVIAKLYDVAARLSGISKADLEELAAVETADEATAD